MTDETDTAPSSKRPNGPCLLVIGMHRSGTSALAGVMGSLGFATPHGDDRMDWPESNPEHWESLTLALHDDHLLDGLGGSWDAPPDLAGGWDKTSDLGRAPDPHRVLAAAYPNDGPFVWKDPRLCLLLPFWRPLLPESLAVILIWRQPLAVADSLHKRDQIDLALGVALWERYNRSAIDNLRGVDTYIASYEALLDDPAASVGSIATWLGSLGQFAAMGREWDVGRAVESVAGSHDRSHSDEPILLDEQRQLRSFLAEHQGGHRPLTLAPAGVESPWSSALIRARREYRSRELDTVRKDLEVWRQAFEQMAGSASWRITKPLRSMANRLPRSGGLPRGNGS